MINEPEVASKEMKRDSQEDNVLDTVDAIIEGVMELSGFSEQNVRTRSGEIKIGMEEVQRRYRNDLMTDTLIVDVRAPTEFDRGHIPGAVNMPLFDDVERAAVGTCFKKQGRVNAIEMGLSYVVPRLSSMADEFRKVMGDRKRILLVCFRGGMRSSSVAWHLDREGFSVEVLNGGYKGFKTHARYLWDEQGMAPFDKICIIGGRTGVGKTKVLHALRQAGEQIVDLEGLGNHNGSTFGHIPFELQCIPQPTSEMYLNLVAAEWMKLDSEKWIFIEDEGQHVGSCSVPSLFYENVLRRCPLVVRLLISVPARVSNLVEEYGSMDLVEHPRWVEVMESAVRKSSKRLGPDGTKRGVELVHEKNPAGIAELMLGFYDKLYDRHIVSAGGTGKGDGARNCLMLDVAQDDALDYIDASGLATGVLEAVHPLTQVKP